MVGLFIIIFFFGKVDFEKKSADSKEDPQVFLGTVEKGIYFIGTEEQRLKFEGNKDNIGEQGT